MKQLSQAQFDYCKEATTARGGSFTPSYTFVDAMIVGAQDTLLAIMVDQGGNDWNKAMKGPKDLVSLDPNDPAFRELVADALSALEKMMTRR